MIRILTISSLFFLSSLLSHTHTHSLSLTHLGVLLSPIITATTYQHTELKLKRLGVQFGNGITGAVFHKATKIPYITRTENESSVEVIFEADVPNLTEFLPYLIKLIFAPLQLALGFYLAYLQMQTAVFWLILVVVASLPLLGILGAVLGYSFTKKRDNTKKRVQLMKEVVNGIRMIKYYAWETSFRDKLYAIRNVDLKYIVWIYFSFIAFFTVTNMVNIVMPLIIFFVYVN